MSHHKPDPSKSVNLTIDGLPVTVPEGTTILEAARKLGIHIPVLCDHPDLKKRAVCRICVVECDGGGKLKAACANDVWEGVKVVTNSPKIHAIRKTIVELILADHPQDCLTCIRNQKCELQKLALQFGLEKLTFPKAEFGSLPNVDTNTLVRDMAKCVKCGRCVEACQEVQTVRAINTAHRSLHYEVTTPYDQELIEGPCVYCGQCAAVCPVGALYENDQTDKVWAAIDDPGRHVVVQTAPAVRVALGDEFGLPPGAVTTGKMVTALKRLGFDKVFDTDFSADVTIMEEGHELLHRLQTGGKLPMITSCSPGWINFAEVFYPDLLGHLSSCKSPQQMFGALAKTYYPQVSGVDAAKVTCVSIMPCVAKKFEAQRPEMNSSGYQDVDVVLTTRELARMIKLAGLDFADLPETAFDQVMGDSTGAAVIFGTSGGVMEAALRTVYEVVVGETLGNLDFEAVRGHEGIKRFEVDLKGTKVKLLVSNGLANARLVMDSIRKGECDATFVEIMCCPGGCVGGGGQPYGNSSIKLQRKDGLYIADKALPIRKSHENPEVKAVYEKFLGKPLGEKSHHLLHTHYNSEGKNHWSKAGGGDAHH
ncbi:MAG: [FeFe] hydrogenase, group A [Deltaproteobacteria bacterium]|jgi:NADH-quinone oxidoreductase subunit G/NADP-reducing hydrogenase subunit HndD|nr:[FeFe] hydrogenase, group A [Deltaproteobacteria bacterium]